MRHFIKNLFQYLNHWGPGANNDRMVKYLRYSTRAYANKDINDLWHKDTIFTNELIKRLVEGRIQRYDPFGYYS